MTVPTTAWGNFSDIYTAIPGPTATSPGSSDGPVLGNAFQLSDGTMVQFLQFTGTTTANQACKFGATWATDYKVLPTTATSSPVIAVNDRSGSTYPTGASVTATYCAWGTVKGLCYPLAAATTAANAFVAASGTAGVVETAVAATHFQGNMVNTVIVGGSQAASPCYIQ